MSSPPFPGGSVSVDGIEYVDGTLELVHTEEGRVVKSGTAFRYDYVLKDHLGNGRVGFHAVTGSVASVPNFTADYYPFGLKYLADARAGNPKNNYLYNNKELQDGLKLYDYGARLYDPVIGRWGSVDPLSENHYGFAAYAYVLDNPMTFIDPLGMDTIGVRDLNMAMYREGEDVVQLDEVNVSATRGLGGRNYGGAMGNVGTGLDVAGLAFGFLGDQRSASLYDRGIRRGVFGNYPLTGRNLSLFENKAMTSTTKPLSRLTSLGKGVSNIGGLLGYASTGVDIYEFSTGSLSGARFGYHLSGTVMSLGTASAVGGPAGTAVGLGFVAGEVAYDTTNGVVTEVGWEFNQFMNTLTREWMMAR